MGDTATSLLLACLEQMIRSEELISLLVEELSIEQEQLLHAWKSGLIPQRGTCGNREWRWFFHGSECDFRHMGDGRFLRVDFGPHGAVNTFSAWGVFQLIEHTVAPWRTFSSLMEAIRAGTRTESAAADAYSQFLSVWTQLEALEWIGVADPLLIDFVHQCSTVDDLGITHVVYPPDTPEDVQNDCSVAHRQCIREAGKERLRQPGLEY